MTERISSTYLVGSSIDIPGPQLAKPQIIVHAKDDRADDISYRLSFDPADRTPESFLVDSSTGKMLYKVSATDKLNPGDEYTATLRHRQVSHQIELPGTEAAKMRVYHSLHTREGYFRSPFIILKHDRRGYSK